MIENAENLHRTTWPRRRREDWNLLLAALRPHLMRVLEMRGVDRELAEDLAQEALALIWHKLESLREPRRLSSWATSIALNQLRSHRRHRVFDVIPRAVPGRWPEPPQILIRAEGRAWVARALSTLTEEQKVSVTMRLSDGLSPPAISEALGISLSCFRYRFGQGLRSLRLNARTTQGRGAAAALGWPA